MVVFLRPKKAFFPSRVYEIGLLVLLLFKESVYHFLVWFKNLSVTKTQILEVFLTMPFKVEGCHRAASASAVEVTLLDLPELVLESILAKLSPAELCRMYCVCRYLRERCGRDHLWETHMKEKWSRVLGDEALRKWDMQASKRKLDNGGEPRRGNGMWPLPWLKQKLEGERKPRRGLQAEFFLELESGRFSFPAQVYNRENGNAGFLLSCYDAEISYNSRRNFFYARYPSHGKRIPAIEEVPWERIRSPPVDTSPHVLHISDCLSNFYPGDHVEIQWRKNKDFPYDTIVIEFNHYAMSSSWRRMTIDRKEHREDGGESNGFYGGIRKLQRQDEISMWMQFWPADVVD